MDWNLVKLHPVYLTHARHQLFFAAPNIKKDRDREAGRSMNSQASSFSAAARDLDFRRVIAASAVTGISLASSLSWNTAIQRLVDGISADDESIPAAFVSALLCTAFGIGVIYCLHRCHLFPTE